MIKKKGKRKSNQGNSFVVVVATLSFLAVLVTALLVAVALCYRLKAYDINTRDNFYYLEQAMDEIYAGVGEASMKHLNNAFEETAEVLVYYDTEKKTYATMDNENANKLLKATFINKVHNDARFTTANVKSTLESFITNLYSSSNPEGVQLSVGNSLSDDKGLVIKDLVLKRTAKYSTRTAKAGSNAMGSTDFVQSITTDLAIGMPDLTIDFSLRDSLSELYDFVIISDMGVEISGGTTKSNIWGNVYAASDFYNKDYENTVIEGGIPALSQPLNNKVNYDDNLNADCNGVNETSMYSGFYVSGAKVSVVADKLIVPGSIAAMNCANMEVMGFTDEAGTSKNSQVWADEIILGGYSAKRSIASDSVAGSSLKMKADAFVYDDLELNATSSTFALSGNYYGYNYASIDNRVYEKAFVEATTKRKFLSGIKFNDGNILVYDDNDDIDPATGKAKQKKYVGQAHYNSSSIVVNGFNSTLNFKETDSMYIAGQAYIELSKDTETTNYEATYDGGDFVDINRDTAGSTSADAVGVDTYKYKTDTDTEKNYTQNLNEITNIQDYRTGEALSFKSNQLAYIPPYNVELDFEDVDGDGEYTFDPNRNGKIDKDAAGNYTEDYINAMYVKWPDTVTQDPYFEQMWEDLEHVPVIMVRREDENLPSYFYDFSKATDGVKMNEFMEKYANLFTVAAGSAHSIGDLANFYDITPSKLYEVKNIYKDTDGGTKMYTNSAISMVKDSKVNIVANSSDIQPLLDIKKALNRPYYTDDDMTEEDPTVAKVLGEAGTAMDITATNATKVNYSTAMTTGLQKRYREMKMLLTDKSKDAVAVTYAYDHSDSYLTPINYYFDFSKLSQETIGDLQSKYMVYMSDEDLRISSSRPDGRVRGIVMCKGDVTFDNNVKEFEGLIVAGGKVKVTSSINFVANAEIIKSILSECDESEFVKSQTDHHDFCELFRHYKRTAKKDPDEDKTYETLKSVTAVQYEDILSFNNWKKNVD